MGNYAGLDGGEWPERSSAAELGSMTARPWPPPGPLPPGQLLGGAGGASAASAAYLRQILACEESLRAAFEPVLRAARCRYSGYLDRNAFAQAVVRISSYFNPSEPISLRGPAIGPPYSVEEALGHFRTVLQLLADRLEEMGKFPFPVRRPKVMALMDGGSWGEGSVEGAPVRSEGFWALQSPFVATQPQGPGWASNGALPRGRRGASRSASLPSSVRTSTPSRHRARDSAAVPVGFSQSWSGMPQAPQQQLAPQQPQAQPQPLGAAGEQELGASLEASRARVAGLRLALGREDELLRHQAEETQRLEHLQRDLEAEEEAAAQRRLLAAAMRVARAAAAGAAELRHDGLGQHTPQRLQQGMGPSAWESKEPLSSPRATSSGFAVERPRHGGADAAADRAPALAVEEEDILEGPLSLEDVKHQLRTVVRLRRRIQELEGAIDSREEEAAALAAELQRRHAGLVSPRWAEVA